MKTPLSAALALISVFAIVHLLGCVPGLMSTKQSGEPAKPTGAESSPPAGKEFDTKNIKAADEKAGQKSAGRAPVAPTPPKKSEAGGQEPEYNPPPPPEKSTIGAIDLAQKDEIKRAALEFAKNVQKVMHVQTCYSKVYGGWYMFLYLKEKGKNIPHQYKWNPNSQEWEFIYALPEVPGDQLQSYLKMKLAGEQCFLLK